MPGRNLFRLPYCILPLSMFLLLMRGSLWPQAKEPATAGSQNAAWQDAVTELQKQVRELQAQVRDIRAEESHYRAQVDALQQELEEERRFAAKPRIVTAVETSAQTQDDAAADTGQGENTEQRLAKVEEEQQLLSEKINEQYQTKVESASKYRVKLSGIVLFNMFGNEGSVDNLDFPETAAPRAILDSRGSFGGTLRQSQLRMEIFGPDFAGAKTSADVQFDFAGGFPGYSNGATQGIMRLRTGTIRLDWKNTAVVAGQDSLFISPLSPTSFASLAVPALSYAGNLWAWTPQVRVEHRIDISEGSNILIQGGLLDPLTGETPVSQYFRQAEAGERSRFPAAAARVAWTQNIFGRPLTIGVGGYYERQKWGFRRKINGWAGTSDWSLPLNRWFSLSGEVHRGAAIGGLGGSLGRSALWDTALSNPQTDVDALNTVGGWAQLKFKPTESRVEFNAAFGQENPFAGQVSGFSGGQISYYDTIVRNQSALANVIYRPRSNLIFSIEYRHLRTFSLDHSSEIANQVNSAMGIIF